MKSKTLLITLGIVFIFSMALMVLISQSIVSAQECQVIRIEQEKGGAGLKLSLVPDKVSIPKGSCVVWINWVPKQEVKVMFKDDGKKCADNTEAHVGFKMKMPENCFLADLIPLGGTSSLRFEEAGTFKYQVVVPGEQMAHDGPLAVGFGPVMGEGQIIVQ